MKIEIQSTLTNHRSLTSKAGKPIDLYEQTCYLHQDNEPYPARFVIAHRTNTPLVPGFYRIADASFRISRFGNLELDPYSLNLVPIETKGTVTFPQAKTGT